ncbi:hypothetical protein BU24DRAFT_459978 [Aaosphaeria arxii CBS 175.79]|uniref:GATA-type domain-containing protein n=1 Tax=Aaosphaeria arxii CBS 175.79 TaxID=1450172 RepID=A0A6A5XW45_9PLEO|nr:uncharacterized protein BU24DRAFT_459978 [Aaosphaeria arxii CBS 175.79]KAF2016860.1 hypothetical protein BU24DRAFT_459978 [Aaosphaeria arxii CBS 175.79]
MLKNASISWLLPPNAPDSGTSSVIPHSTKNEFTKHHDWTQHVLSGIRDFLHVLSPEGTILHASSSSKHVVGYEPTRLLGRSVGELIHPEDFHMFTKDFHESILYGSVFRSIYRFRSAEHGWIILDARGRPYWADGPNQVTCPSTIAAKRQLVITARPYLTKAGVLADSFVEQEILQERLTRQIEELRGEEHEEESEEEEEESQWAREGDMSSNASVIRFRSGEEIWAATPSSMSVASHRLSPGPYNAAHDECSPVSNPPGRFGQETNSHSYIQKKQSRETTTATSNPMIGDAGIPIANPNKVRTSSKPWIKKPRRCSESKKELHICLFCSTIESPEWRKGPNGQKTLCNACGLRWSKAMRKSSLTSKGETGTVSSITSV